MSIQGCGRQSVATEILLGVDVEDAPHVLGDAHFVVVVVEPTGAVVVSS